MTEADKFIAEVTRRANEVRKVLSGDFDQVVRVVREHDLVFAVWSDANQARGVGLIILKGEDLLAAMAADEISVNVSWTAIPCIEVEQAEALKRVIDQERPTTH